MDILVCHLLHMTCILPAVRYNAKSFVCGRECTVQHEYQILLGVFIYKQQQHHEACRSWLLPVPYVSSLCFLLSWAYFHRLTKIYCCQDNFAPFTIDMLLMVNVRITLSLHMKLSLCQSNTGISIWPTYFCILKQLPALL